ncbi:PepSY-associated TM helix domain-containing protein [Arenicella xantha]|uniref:Putative iron-regulated membrane protein n=1 Tax=Arenicella xantha TaxID=644221 RepID=A0A395JN04_9GAMM|nr:PepSY-associated TM helix domain-containing protein [Arenicella xantha]RBP52929.1 putative iron-regulated membrane protein [Arenicella xantha]
MVKIILTRTYWLACAATALLLVIVALTGSVQAYYYEIDEWLNPDFYQTDNNRPMLPPAEIIAQFEAQVPSAEVWYQQVAEEPGRSSMLAVSPRKPLGKQAAQKLEYNYYYVDPSNGEIIGARAWGKCCFEPENLVNYLYELHHSLTIPGARGFQLIGAVACLWLLACLSLLARALIAKKGATWLSLSAPATIIVALVMLPFAISSIAMNFSAEIFKPITSVFSPVKPSVYEEYGSKAEQDFGDRNLSYTDAYNLATGLGAQRNWPYPIGELFYSRAYNFYGMAFGSRDPSGMGNNWLYLSGVDGRIVAIKTPAQGTAGDLFYFSQLPLHSGRLLGTASQFWVFLVGLLTAALSFKVFLYALLRSLKGSIRHRRS